MKKLKFQRHIFLREVFYRIHNDWGRMASQSEIADITGISQSTISRIANMKSNGYNITVNQMALLITAAEREDISIEDFFIWEY